MHTFSAVPVLAISLALVLGACSSDGDTGAAPSTQSSSTSEPTDSGTSTDDGAESSTNPAEVRFRPVIVRRAAEAKLTQGANKKLRKMFTEEDCTATPSASPAKKATVACDGEKSKYLLGPAIVVDRILSAQAREVEGDWVVSLRVDKKAQRKFTDLLETAERPVVAIEQEGSVLQARAVSQLAEKGRTSIGSGLSEDEAQQLVEQLSAGAEG